jgi:hypothetical protein
VTSFRQWTANRENAQKSTGPRTEEGKCRSRRNALRHGLAAETVVEGLEDPEDYRAFEATIIADYDATTGVERELVLRLSSLLWRIRRATGIETDLLRIQAEIIRAREVSSHPRPANANPPHSSSCSVPRLRYRVLGTVGGAAAHDEAVEFEESPEACARADDQEASPTTNTESSRQLTHCFLRLANLDNAAFDRLARYEATLWRQVVQTMFALEPLRGRRYRSEYSMKA